MTFMENKLKPFLWDIYDQKKILLLKVNNNYNIKLIFFIKLFFYHFRGIN